MRYVHGRRLRRLLAALLITATALGAMLAHASHERAEDEARNEARVALVRLVGAPDLALSSSARWLRHPSQAEAGAATSDGPLAFDSDPAGAWIGPPRALLGVGHTEPRRDATRPQGRR
jgi:hypothetical protein